MAGDDTGKALTFPVLPFVRRSPVERGMWRRAALGLLLWPLAGACDSASSDSATPRAPGRAVPSVSVRDGAADVALPPPAPPPFGLYPVDATQCPRVSACVAVLAEPVTTCSYALPETEMPINPSQLNLIYRASDGTCYLVFQNLSSDCRLGWHYTDDSLTELELCGSTCDKLVADPGGRVELMFACHDPPPLY